MFHSHSHLGHKAVLAHGDVWLNNMIMENGDPNKILAIIDWQLCRRGSAMEDLAILMARAVFR